VKYLDDDNPMIRAIALEKVGLAGGISREMAISFLDDPSMEVKRAAMQILQREKNEKKIF
jgi:hypothetical protein